MPNKSKYLILAHVSMFAVALIYAANFSLAKMIMPLYIGAFAFIFLRVGAATILFWIFSWNVKEKIDRKDLPQLVLCGFFGVALNMMTFFKGLEYTTPINGALIMLLTPILVSVFSFVILKEKLKWTKIVGLIMGLIGAYILINQRQNVEWNANNIPLGNLLVAINAASYGVYLIMIKPLTQKYNYLLLLRWTFTFGFCFVIPFSWSELTEIRWSEWPAFAYWVLLYVLIAVTFLTYLLNGWALTIVSPALVGAYIYLQPLLTSFIAIVGGFDVMNLTMASASIFIFIGVYMVGKK